MYPVSECLGFGMKFAIGIGVFRSNMANLQNRIRLHTPNDTSGDGVALVKGVAFGCCWWFFVPLMGLDVVLGNKPYRHLCPDYFTHHLIYDDMFNKNQLTLPDFLKNKI